MEKVPQQLVHLTVYLLTPKKVKSPLLLIYFNDDIVCRLESTEELGQELHDAGVDVSLLTADGPHLGCIQSAFE